MTESLFSERWYRVAPTRPGLRPQVRVRRQHWRDQRWYLLADEATGRRHRVNEAGYAFLGRCDGRRTVQQVWEAVLAASPDAAPTQDETIQLLAQLDERDLLQWDSAPAADALGERRRKRSRQKRNGMINPLAFRLPLGDPSALLARLDPLAQWLFRPATFWVWLAIVAVAAVAAAADWGALRAHAQTHLASPRDLALAWVCFPLLKALHELGHALAVRRWGGEVHEVGIGLLVLLPAPYVDASASSAFPRRIHRAAVGAAGVMAELGAAALALLLWFSVQPGLVQDIAFVVMFIGAASTLLFNGNPLLRFDGYFVLCDLLDLPNLAPRSSLYWNWLLRRYLFGVRGDAPPAGAGERKWLLAYAPLSLAWRLILSIAIVLWLGAQWFLLGLAIAAWLAFAMLLRPVWNWVSNALDSARPGRELARVRLSIAVGSCTAGLLLFVVPLPHSTVASAVVWLPEQAQVRPEVDGFIVGLPVRDGEAVEAGQVLAVLENPELHAARDALDSRLLGLQADHYQLLTRDAVAAANLAEEIARTEAERARAEERIDQLRVRARVAGRLVMPRQADLPGAHIANGTTIGHVLEGIEPRVRATVPGEHAYLVANHTRHAEVRLAEAPGVALQARMAQATPAGTRDLPSPALGDRGGGPHPTDPADPHGTRSLATVFLVDVTLPGNALPRVGQRAWVRFDHGSEPFALQLYRHALQLFLQHFDTKR